MAPLEGTAGGGAEAGVEPESLTRIRPLSRPYGPAAGLWAPAPGSRPSAVLLEPSPEVAGTVEQAHHLEVAARESVEVR